MVLNKAAVSLSIVRWLRTRQRRIARTFTSRRAPRGCTAGSRQRIIGTRLEGPPETVKGKTHNCGNDLTKFGVAGGLSQSAASR